MCIGVHLALGTEQPLAGAGVHRGQAMCRTTVGHGSAISKYIPSTESLQNHALWPKCHVTRHAVTALRVGVHERLPPISKSVCEYPKLTCAVHNSNVYVQLQSPSRL